MDNITQEQIDALIEFIDNTEEPASITNVMAAAILAFLNLKVRQMVTVDDLNNEATARENADSLLQVLIDALNQTAVRYSDVGEIVPELGGLGMLALDQSPLVIFESMGAAYDGVSRTVTLHDGQAKYEGTGGGYLYNRRGNIGYNAMTSDKVYFNSYTGRLYRWTGSSFELVGGGGIDGGIYEIIKSNVNLVAAKLDALIGALAMLAFSGTVDKNTLKVGTLSWIEPETHTPRLVSPVANSTIDCGTAYEDEYDIQKTIYIQGANLTNGLTLAITEGSQNFSLAGGSSSVSKNDALAGTNITVIYTSSSSVAEATGKLRIFGGGVDVTVNLRGTYSEQGGGGGDTPTPSEITASKPTFKVGAALASTSSGANLAFDESSARSTHCCTTEYIDLTGEWDRIEIKHDFMSNNVERIYCLVLCRYRNRNTGTVGYTTPAYAQVTNTNNNYGKDHDNKIITIKRLYTSLELNQPTGDYEVTGIAFGVRKDSSAATPSVNSYAKIFANESDTQPVKNIFLGNDSSTYDIEP